MKTGSSTGEPVTGFFTNFTKTHVHKIHYNKLMRNIMQFALSNETLDTLNKLNNDQRH